MSEFTDDTLSRYLDQQPGMRAALLNDPVQKMQAEALRRTLDMMERALAAEGVSEEVQRRAINRVVWGEPEGQIDMHTARNTQKQALADRDLPPCLTGAWEITP